MKLGKETVVKYHNFETEMSKAEEISLLEYAKKNIFNDKQYVISWAVNEGLKNYIASLEMKNNTLKKLIKKQKRG